MIAAEAFANASLGLLVSWCATLLLLPMWGLSPTPTDAAGITAMFFCLSFARSYGLRRLFAWLS